MIPTLILSGITLVPYRQVFPGSSIKKRSLFVLAGFKIFEGFRGVFLYFFEEILDNFFIRVRLTQPLSVTISQFGRSGFLSRTFIITTMASSASVFVFHRYGILQSPLCLHLFRPLFYRSIKDHPVPFPFRIFRFEHPEHFALELLRGDAISCALFDPVGNGSCHIRRCAGLYGTDHNLFRLQTAPYGHPFSLP